jgi:hypothetical protein
MIPNMEPLKAEDVRKVMMSAGFVDVKTSRKKNMFCVVGHKK